MKMKSSTEFKIDGKNMDYKDVEQLWNAVQAAGTDCTVTIEQRSYDERPYGTYTTTDITVEAS